MRSSYGEPPSHPTQKALRARNSEVIFTQHLPSALSPPTLCGYTHCATVFVTVFTIISYILQYFYLFVKSFSKYLKRGGFQTVALALLFVNYTLHF